MRAAVQFTERVVQVGERIALTGQHAALVFPPAVDQFAQHCLEVAGLHLSLAAR